MCKWQNKEHMKYIHKRVVEIQDMIETCSWFEGIRLEYELSELQNEFEKIRQEQLVA